MLKSLYRHLALCMWTLLLAACAGRLQIEPTRTPASPSSDLEAARETLRVYFDALNTGDYDTASDLYGGELDLLAEWNPDVDPATPAMLFEALCSRQLMCLPVRSIVYANETGERSFQFTLEFSNPDGTLFVLGPCCGASETEMPPVSQFDCTVEKTSKGEYKVGCLPVYVP